MITQHVNPTYFPSRSESGFTLIEIMIVVAIIGILAAVTIPAYQNYTIRSRVIEGLDMASPAKAMVAENALMTNTDLAVGWNAPDITTNVSLIAIDSGNGEVTITYTAIAGNGTIIMVPTSGGNPLVAGTSPSSGEISWNCTSGTLDNKYRPANCRN